MTNYFATCTTLDEAKKEFYRLAKIHHPDRGGATATMQEILKQFENFKPKSEKFQGEQAAWTGGESASYAAIVSALINIPEIVVEIIGSFVWVSGNTKPHKDAIKAVPVGEAYKSAMWHSKKTMWYFAPKGYRKYSGGEMSIDEIRAAYGSTVVNKSTRPVLAD